MTAALLAEIARNTALLTENIHKVIELDTSITTPQTVNVYNELGIAKGTSISILSAGGGLHIGVSLEDPLEVGTNDSFTNELFEQFNWYGSGAGTAILRIGGRI
jgi:hypothetical protein